MTTTADTADNDTAAVVVTINGVNDQPEIALDASSSVTEDMMDPMLTAAGTVTVSDVDSNDVLMVTTLYNGDASWSGGALSAALGRMARTSSM